MEKRKKSSGEQNSAGKIRQGSTGWLVKSLGAWLDIQMDLRLKPLGLSRSQFTIIMTLLEGDELTQAEIGRKVLMPGYATTRNIDKLELNGLLERQPHKSSRRAHNIYLTEKARELAPALFSIVKEVNQTFLESIDGRDRNKFNTILSRLHDELIYNS